MDLYLNWKLCKGIPEAEVFDMRKKTSPRKQSYQRGAIIALEDEDCSSIGVVVSGQVVVQRQLANGNLLVLDRLQRGGSFGEVIIFSDRNTYPATILAEMDSVICFISKSDVVMLCQLSPIFLRNFMGQLSNRILLMNQKIKTLTFSSVRQKTANFILDAYHQQKRTQLLFVISRNDMANQLGLPRPSFSRELAALKAEGLIEYDRKSITILKLELLQACLYP
jgi:CRP-like cAMP-binding protein